MCIIHVVGQVLFGSGLLTPFIQGVAGALLSLTVPAEWTKRWETGPEKPQAWLKELVRKRVTLIKWRAAVGKGSLLTDPLNLGDVFNPATFINALRQLTARSLGTAIDRMKMVSSWDRDSSQLRAKCPHICMLSGLLLQGAIMHNKGYLLESPPEANELFTTNIVSIGFVPITTTDNIQAVVQIPVFVSTSREQYLMDIAVPLQTEGNNATGGKRNGSGTGTGNSAEDRILDERKWVLAGVALFLSVDE